MYKLILYIILSVAIMDIYAQQRYNVEFADNSILTILGSTNVIPFKLTQKIVTFTGKRRTFTINTIGNKIRLTENKIDIPVSMFESDNKMALRDFKKLINEEKHPDIALTFNQISAYSTNKGSKKISATAFIDLNITGQTKSYQIPFETQLNDKNMHLTGKKRISIRDFGLEPPVTMLGLIKVSEWIEIEVSTDCIVNKIVDTASR